MGEQGSLLVPALLAFAVGGTSGLVGAVFRLDLERSDRFRASVIDWAHGKEIAGFALVIGISTIATGLASWLVRKLAPGAKGSGIPDVEAVLRDEQPPPPLILIPVKFLGGALAMGAGLALGREGPTVQMGAGIGHFLATAFRRNQDDVKALLAAGAGAGLATALSAPVAGAVFVLEELGRSRRYRRLGPRLDFHGGSGYRSVPRRLAEGLTVDCAEKLRRTRLIQPGQ